MPKSCGKFDFGYKKHACHSWACSDNSTRSSWSPPQEVLASVRCAAVVTSHGPFFFFFFSLLTSVGAQDKTSHGRSLVLWQDRELQDKKTKTKKSLACASLADADLTPVRPALGLWPQELVVEGPGWLVLYHSHTSWWPCTKPQSTMPAGGRRTGRTDFAAPISIMPAGLTRP